MGSFQLKPQNVQNKFSLEKVFKVKSFDINTKFSAEKKEKVKNLMIEMLLPVILEFSTNQKLHQNI